MEGRRAVEVETENGRKAGGGGGGLHKVLET